MTEVHSVAVPSVEERLARLREYGYPIYHVIGNWYIGREYSYRAAKWSWWSFYRMVERK